MEMTSEQVILGYNCSVTVYDVFSIRTRKYVKMLIQGFTPAAMLHDDFPTHLFFWKLCVLWLKVDTLHGMLHDFV